MATVYCTHVFPDGTIYRWQGETVSVGDLTYVKRPYLEELEPSDRYLATQEAADEVAALAIEKQIAGLHDVLAKLRPLPAAAAADHSAAGRAHAGVAT